MSRTFFIISARSGEIVNAVECQTRGDAERVAANMIDGENLRVNENPTPSQLSRYRFWNERP